MPDAAPVTPTTPDAPAAPAAEPDGNTLPSDNAIVEALEKGKPIDGSATPPDPAKKKDDPKKEPDKPKESALLRSMQKREQDLIRDRAALQSREQTLQANIQAQIQAGVQEALRKQFADPRTAIKMLKDMGLKPNELGQALVSPETPSTDELARQALAEAKDLKDRLEKEAQTRTSTSNEQEFLSAARMTQETHKELWQEWTEPEILTEAYRLAAEVKAECEKENRPLPNVSNERVLAVLNRRAKSRLDARAERLKPKDDPAKPKDEPAKPKNGTSTTTLGKNLGERQSVVTTDPVLMSNEDVIKQVEKQLAEGVNIKAR